MQKSRALLAAVITLPLGLAAVGGGVASAGSLTEIHGSNGSATSQGPINIWYSNNAQEVAWGEQMVAAWNAANPRQKVTGQQIPSAQSSEEVIGAAITAGSEPCLIYNTSPASVPTLEQQGGLVPLNGFPGAAAYIDGRTGPSANVYKSPDGLFYQMPWKSNPVMIFFNKKEFAKAHISTTNPPLSSYSQFLATAKKLVSSGVAKYAIYPSPSSEFYQSWYDFYPLYAAESGGQELVVNKKATFDDPAGKAVAAFWAQLYAQNLAGKETVNGDTFADGTSVDWGVVPVPTTKGSYGDQVPTFSDAKNIAMYASCKNRLTAWNFLKFSTSPTEDGKLLQMTGQMPMRQGIQQMYASYFKANPAYKEFAAEAAHVIEVPNVNNSIQVWQVFRDAWSKSVIFGKENTSTALAGAAVQIDKLVQTNSSGEP